MSEQGIPPEFEDAFDYFTRNGWGEATATACIEYIQSNRNNTGKTQSEIAEKHGVSATTISNQYRELIMWHLRHGTG